MVTEGIAAFVNLTDHEEYRGKSTGNYTIVVTVDDDEAAKLEAAGVKLKFYKGSAQRKFKTQYDFTVVDVDGEPTSKRIPYGSKVRIQWNTDKTPHPEYGASTYLQKVRVVELAEGGGDDEDF